MPTGWRMIRPCAGWWAAAAGPRGLDQPDGALRDRGADSQEPVGLADLSGHWIDRVQPRRPVKGIVLDMDSSVSPTFGEERSVQRAIIGCTCYHPLFVFNQFGDLERCALRARQRPLRRGLA